MNNFLTPSLTFKYFNCRSRHVIFILEISAKVSSGFYVRQSSWPSKFQYAFRILELESLNCELGEGRGGVSKKSLLD